MTFRSFLRGPPQFVATTPWPAVIAVPATLMILVSAQAIAALALAPLAGMDVTALPGLRPGGVNVRPDGGNHRALMLLLIVSQAAVIALTFATALRGGWGATLSLDKPADGWITLLYAVAAMAGLVALFNLVALGFAPEQAARDFQFFRDIARTPSLGVTILAIGIGAPLSEELLFRGFLVASLSRSRLGFWPAAVLATLGWTLLHLGYSWIGLAEVFLFGLYFSWLLWRTGSLWPPLVCHAVYNTVLVGVLRSWPAV